MKKEKLMKKVTSIALTGVMVLGMFSFTACGSQSSDSDAASGAKKVTVAISTENMPYSYMNEDGEYEGYEYEILKDIKDRISDKYDMQITMDEWTNLLVGIDTGNYAAAGGSFGYTEERAEKYSYSAIPILNSGKFYIGYKKGRTDITDMKSLAGKTVASTKGLLAEQIVLDWNKDNPDYQINLAYPEAGYEPVYSGIENGLYDAYIASKVEMNTFNSRFDNFMDVTQDSVYESDNGGIYFIFSKDQSDFQSVFDEALSAMKDDGTLSELSVKWVGEDLTE